MSIYRAKATNAWTTAATWQLSTDGGQSWENAVAAPPSGEGHDIIIAAGFKVSNPTASWSGGSLLVEASGVLQRFPSGNVAMTFSGAVTINGTLNRVTITTTGTSPMIVSSGGVWSVASSVSASFSGGLRIDAGAALNVGGALSLTVTGSVLLDGVVTSTGGSLAVTMIGDAVADSLTCADGSAVSITAAKSAGTVEVNAAGVNELILTAGNMAPIAGLSCGTFSMSGGSLTPGGFTITANQFSHTAGTIVGDVNLAVGTLTIGELTQSGNWTVNGASLSIGTSLDTAGYSLNDAVLTFGGAGTLLLRAGRHRLAGASSAGFGTINFGSSMVEACGTWDGTGLTLVNTAAHVICPVGQTGTFTNFATVLDQKIGLFGNFTDISGSENAVLLNCLAYPGSVRTLGIGQG